MSGKSKFAALIATGLLGLSLWLLAQPLRATAQATPTPDPMNMSGHDHGERLDVQNVSVKIVSPKAGALLENNAVIVRIETTNWELGEGQHFHLYVNGQEQGMSQGSNPALQARDLQPGENTLEVVLSDELHRELNATDKIMVHVGSADTSTTEASAPAAPTGIPSGVLLTLFLVAMTVAAILGIGFVLVRRKS